MEVTNSSSALLCNHEALMYLNELKLKGQTGQEKNRSLATILYETSHYLTNFLNEAPKICNVEGFLEDLLAFPAPLTKTEKLSLVNTPPMSPLQLSLIVKDCDERLTESQVELLLGIIKKHTVPESQNTNHKPTDPK